MLYAELNDEDVEAAVPRTHEWCKEITDILLDLQEDEDALPDRIEAFIQEHGIKSASALCRLGYWDRIRNHLLDAMHMNKNNGARLFDTLAGRNHGPRVEQVMHKLWMAMGALIFNGEVI
jgi:hypothetical protein